MSDVRWRLPSLTLDLVESAPRDRAVVVLLRHSVRDELPPGDVGYSLPITADGYRLALELGQHLRGRIRTLHSSPLSRCIQTAQALAEGALADQEVVPNDLLGDPGVFVLDGQSAWTNWQKLGNEGVIRHLVSESAALPGMARPDEAARFLVQSMLSIAADRSGVHIFVTHDSLVTATAARMLGVKLDLADWPCYLEGVFFWTTEEGIHTAYRRHQTVRAQPLLMPEPAQRSP